MSGVFVWADQSWDDLNDLVILVMTTVKSVLLMLYCVKLWLACEEKG